MKLNPKDVSTIVILNKNKEGSKTLQVPTKHINRLKHYVIAIASIFIFLVCCIIFLQNRNSKQELEKQLLLSQITKLKGEIPVEMQKAGEQHSAQNYVQAIEIKL